MVSSEFASLVSKTIYYPKFEGKALVNSPSFNHLLYVKIYSLLNMNPT